ncbi:MAG: hypothetical protein AAGB34_06020 [Planctomycetota bacterium]
MRRTLAILLILAFFTLSACVEERIVEVRGWRSTKSKTVANTSWQSSLAQFVDLESLGEPQENNPLRRVTEAGEVTLVSQSPRHLISHLYTTLTKEEHELLYDQVISDRTKREFREAGKDPREALEVVVQSKAAIVDLLLTMPAGEQTPGAYVTRSRDRYLLASPIRGDGGALSTLDMVIERGMLRLYTIR